MLQLALVGAAAALAPGRLPSRPAPQAPAISSMPALTAETTMDRRAAMASVIALGFVLPANAKEAPVPAQKSAMQVKREREADKAKALAAKAAAKKKAATKAAVATAEAKKKKDKAMKQQAADKAKKAKEVN